MLTRLAAFVFAAVSPFVAVGAQASSRATMAAEVKSIASGTPFTVALHLEHPKDWHSYYWNSGGVELPPAIKWKLPEGFTAGPIQWPVPKVKEGFFGKSYVYEGEASFLIDIKPPASLTPGSTITLTADAEWQICEESCINEKESFTLNLPVAATAAPDPATAALFAAARAALPKTPAGLHATASRSDDTVEIRVSIPDGASFAFADFIPDQPYIGSAGAGGSITQADGQWLVRVPRIRKDALDEEIPQGDGVSGILTGKTPVLVPLTSLAFADTSGITSGATSKVETSVPANVPINRFLRILGGMILGGLILNLMPCVFPVIGLKIMGFVQQAGADRRKVVLHGVSFTIGVFLSFAVLSGILFAILSSGGVDRSAGWGYQLQFPWVVLSLMLLMFVMGLSMYGVFEIGTNATSVGGALQTKQGLAGSFFSGLLATIVATPCSAPFLGSAIGATVTLPAVPFFISFGAMALGLALPYLVLSIFPKLVDFLPRPGPWMESFKQAMSFLLFATAGYLLWVYGGLIDFDNLLGPVFGLTCIAIAGWIHGRWNLPHRRQGVRAAAAVLTLGFAVAGLLLSKPPAAPTEQNPVMMWEPWSEARQRELLAAGTPVYIDFTAKWCATCQVNKKRAYPPEVIFQMRKKGVVALKADKTKPNPEIERALQQYGRTAIPVNVLIPPKGQPIVLPEILSPGDMLEALDRL